MKRSFDDSEVEWEEIHQPNRYGQYPLHIAIEAGDIDTVIQLLSKGANINEPLVETGGGHCSLAGESSTHWNSTPPIPLQHFTPLMLACRWGHTAIAELLIAKGAELNAINAEGLTALHIATEQGQIDILKQLFQRKVFLAGWYATKYCEQPSGGHDEPITSLNRVHPYTMVTPLSIAVENLNGALLTFLLSEETAIQADFKALNWNFVPFKNQTLMRYQKELTLNTTSQEEMMTGYRACPIHWLAFAQEDNAVKFSETLKVLLEWGFDINERAGDQGASLLHLLCSVHDEHRSREESIKVALQWGASPYQLDEGGNTPFVYYCRNYYHPPIAFFDFLIEQGVDLEKAFVWGKSFTGTPRILFWDCSDNTMAEWQAFFLEYLPFYYVQFCHRSKISQDNWGGLINRTVTAKNILSYQLVESPILAFQMQWDKKCDVRSEEYKRIQKWAICELQHFKTMGFTEAKLHEFFKVLSAYLIGDPAYVNEAVKPVILEAFLFLIDKLERANQLNVEDLKALKNVLEVQSGFDERTQALLHAKMLFIYRKLYSDLPSLKLLALEKILLGDCPDAKCLFLEHRTIIEPIYYAYPLKTKKIMSRFNGLVLRKEEMKETRPPL